MGKSKRQKAAEKAALIKGLEEKYNALPAEASEEEKQALLLEISTLNDADLESQETVAVKFIASPTGSPFFLAYNVGDEGEFNLKQAAELIELGLAETISEDAE